MSNHHHHSHSHGHHHGHHHGHSHHHGEGEDSGHNRVMRGLRLTFFLNLGFAIFEFVGGYLTNSVAVMSDALHDLGDALALGLAWWFERKSVQGATKEYTYGYRRFSLLSSVMTGTILLIGSVFVIREAVSRILNPEPVVAWGMLLMAVFGIAINGWSLLQFSRGGGANERMIRLHLIEDVAGWVILLLTAAVLQFVDWPWLDAVVGLGLAIWIVFNVIRQLISVAEIFLQAGPKGLSISEIETAVAAMDGVEGSHHTHLWSLDGEKHILTMHVRVAAVTPTEELIALKARIKNELKTRFSIFEATIEIEYAGEACGAPEH